MSNQNEKSTFVSEKTTAIIEKLFGRYPDLDVARPGLVEVYNAIVDTFCRGGILYVCGNGGSFADAIHIKSELAKSFILDRPIADAQVIKRLKESDGGRDLIGELEMGLPVVVLGESHALRSAFENDRDPVLSYAQELNSFLPYIKAGIFMGISTSGNARNVLAAMTLARGYGLATIGFTGPDGGQLAKLADIPWRVPGDITPQIQENQIPLYHGLCMMIEEHFFSGD